ncbi:MAG: T9SS type A sorting domain-containing protein [Bacteroidales bacterium]|jgi:hypothetical protein|nr:T9SS type A sorting domain-containing protein [Bacteroidales bacterium]
MKTYVNLTGMCIALFMFFSAQAQEYATFTITSPNHGTGEFTNAALPDFTWETMGSLSQNVQILDDETFEDGSQFEADYGQADNEMNLRTQVVPNGAGTAGTTISSGAVTTIIFEEPTPANAWGFCLTDIDVENVLFHATDADGYTVPIEVINNWLVELFDADHSDGVDLPKWDPEYAALLGSDTPEGYTFDTLVMGGLPSCEAPAAYLKPTIPISTLSITFLNLQEDYNTSYHLFIASLDPSAIDEQEEKIFSIYPNPCSGVLHLQYSISDIRYSKIELVDISGKIVRSIEVNDQSPGQHHQAMGVSDLPTGMYFVKVVNGNNTAVKKLLIQ